MGKKKKTEKIGTIKFADLVINASDKMNRSMQEVYHGTGSWDNKKNYKRSREKRKIEHELESFED